MADSAISPFKFDFVVATTFASINQAFKEYLRRLPKSEPISVCVIASNPQNQTEISFETLKKNTGVDPFSIPDGTEWGKSPDLQTLSKANFFFGMRGQLAAGAADFKGDVPMALLSIARSTDNASRVQFAPVWKTFDVVSLYKNTTTGNWEWSHLSKPSKPNVDWVVGIDVPFARDSRLGYERWKQDTMNARTTALMDKFGAKYGWGNVRVHRLLVDMANADVDNLLVNQASTWAGLPGLVFVAFKQWVRALMQKVDANLFVLGFMVTVPPVVSNPNDPGAFIIAGPVRLSSFNVRVQPRQSDALNQIATIDYQCVANDLPQPAPQRITWDWVPDIKTSQSHHGIVSVSRQTMAYYLHKQLDAFATAQSLQPNVYIAVNGYEYTLSLSPGQSPANEERPTTGTTLLRYTSDREGYDSGGLADNVTLRVKSHYVLSADFDASNLVLTQTRTLWIDAEDWDSSRKGYIFARSRKDTYSFVVDADTGGVVHEPAVVETFSAGAEPARGNQDHFEETSDLNNGLDTLVAQAGLRDPAGMDEFDVDFLDGLAFPGMNEFKFVKPGFVVSGDFVAGVNYPAPEK
ncbi:hypothetical protein B0T24DRAFT_722446 [Lasiosphaeria ovina]|uniref:Uncharacterized protein n=1 Tax=Lasiosphaeria ovina TaxID=92902 RepID=A0AAE0K420_9PEZI|nr:hypothetical protein B0T24DRAFT_722446 [Lasiosphaeria ovina]